MRGFRGHGGSETCPPPLPLVFGPVLHARLGQAARPLGRSFVLPEWGPAVSVFESELEDICAS